MKKLTIQPKFNIGEFVKLSAKVDASVLGLPYGYAQDLHKIVFSIRLISISVSKSGIYYGYDLEAIATPGEDSTVYHYPGEYFEAIAEKGIRRLTKKERFILAVDML